MATDTRIRFSLVHLFVMTACIAGILAFGRYRPELAVLISICFLGWLMRRYGHGHLGGIILSLWGIAILSAGAVGWIYYAHEDMFRELGLISGSIIAAIGACLFLGAAALHKHSKPQLFFAAGVLIFLVAWWVVVPDLGNARIAQREANDTLTNNAAMAKAIEQVDKVCRQLGRVPEESEIEVLLDEPLPKVQWDTSSRQIQYELLGKGHYRLTFCNWDIFVYDNTTPNRGWYRIPF